MGCSPSKGKPPKHFLFQTITDHKSGINCMVLSDDGSLLISGSDDGTARLWSTQSTPVECLGVLEGHTSYITCCEVKDQYIITGSADNTIRKWFIANAECVYVYQGHESRVSRVLCTGDYIFSTSSDKTARAWLFDPDEIGETEGDASIKVFEGHTKGTYPLLYVSNQDNETWSSGIIITGSADCTARSWSFDSGECIRVFRGHTAPINSMVADDTGTTLYTAGGDTVIRCWNIETGQCQRELRGHEGSIFALILHKRMLYSGSADQTARCWAIEFGECTRVYSEHRHTVSALRFNDHILYTGSGDNIGRMYEAKSGTLRRVFRGHTNAIICMEVIPGRLFTGSYDGTIRVWDTSGIRDETVFGANLKDQFEEDDEELEEDSEDVKKAVMSLDPYVREW